MFKELIACCMSKKILSLFLFFLFLVSFICCSHSTKAYVTEAVLDNITVGAGDEQRCGMQELRNQETADSVLLLYRKLDELTSRVETTAQNYQSDSDLMIEKTNNLFTLWLGISTAFVTIIIGLSIWNNWNQEKSYKESIEKVKRDLEKTAQINKISSIMTCLHSLPEPLMTGDEKERKKYVQNNISMIYDEFVSYSQLVKSDSLPCQNQKYVQLVLSSIKVAIQKSQGVFSDVSSNLCYYTFIIKLNECISKMQNALTPNELNNKLDDVLEAFNDFKTEVLS